MTFRTWQISEGAARGFARHILGKGRRFTIRRLRTGQPGEPLVAGLGLFQISAR